MAIRVLEVKQQIFERNNREAEQLRERLKADHTLFLNFMGAPGCGKTTLLVHTLEQLRDTLRLGIISADAETPRDEALLTQPGVKRVRLRTHGMCHLDATLSSRGLSELGSSELDAVLLDNLGNLICPADFDTGATCNVVVLSVAEGDDKPLAYPAIFELAQVLLITKLDCLPSFDFDLDAAETRVRLINPGIRVFRVSARTGAGMSEWTEWIRGQCMEKPPLAE